MRKAMETAIEAARAGAALVSARRRELGEVRSKSAEIDLVTDVDVAAGVEVARYLLARDPAARFLVEEPEVHRTVGVDPASPDEAEVWLIDPIDGTTSFVHGYPCYSVSVGLLRDGVPVAGTVADVPSERVYHGASAAGAFLDGSAIRCTSHPTVVRALLATGFPYDRKGLLATQLKVLSEVLWRGAQDIRRDGSAALDCCYAARGIVDGFWEFGLKPWDMAAGVVILREAGAKVTGIDGEDWSPASTGILAANPELHSDLLELVKKAGEESSPAL